MPYFQDLSDYAYHYSGVRPGTQNVGWLMSDHVFATADPTEHLLDTLWRFCKVSVVQMRGVHECDFCPPKIGSYFVQRGGENLLTGTSEIRAFGADGAIYAAPTLIYHYVLAHRYAPPEAFLRALNDGPAPPDQAFFDRLMQLDLEWNPTSAPAEKPVRQLPK